MDPDRRIPEDGTLAWVTFNPDLYKHNNIMIIEVPENMRSPSEPFFQLATIDRSIPGNDFAGNHILDKLIPGLPKVTLFEEPKPEDDSSSSPSTNAGSDDDFSGNSIPKKLYPNVPRDTLLKETMLEDDFSRNSISDKLYLGVPKDTLLEEPKPIDDTLPPKKHFPRQNFFQSRRVGYSNAGDRSRPRYYKEPCPQRSNRPNPSEIHPWENLVSSAINDNFVHHRENHPLSHEYPYNSGSFGDDSTSNYSGVFGDVLPLPNYPSSTGILGHHPPNFNPHRVNHPLPQEYPHNPGIFGDVQPPNYSRGFGDVQPSNYSASFGDVHPPPKYRSGTGILGHHPFNFNPTRKYFRSCNPNLRGNHPLNNNAYQEVPRYARMNYGNLNPRDDANQSYQRKKDFRKKNLRKRGHPHAK